MSTSAARRQPSGASHLLATSARMSVAHAVAVDLERQHALRADRRLDLLVGDERRRAAELAVLPHARGLEHHHRVAALALHAAALGLPAALVVGQLAQRRDEVELPPTLPVVAIEPVRRLGAAERAHELLLGGFHSACAPQAGHACFSSAAISDARHYCRHVAGQRPRAGCARSCRSSCPSVARSSTAITSASDTPSACAASAGLSRSGRARRLTAGGDGRRRLTARKALLHHLLRDAEARRPVRPPCLPHRAAASALEPLAHLVLHEVVEVADGGHARALVDRLLDFGRHRHVLDDEAA